MSAMLPRELQRPWEATSGHPCLLVWLGWTAVEMPSRLIFRLPARKSSILNIHINLNQLVACFCVKYQKRSHDPGVSAEVMTLKVMTLGQNSC